MNKQTNEWQSMESAPRDGTSILAQIPGNGNDNIIFWAGPFVAENETDDAWTWVMAEEQGWPDSWDDGVCWGINSNLEPSVRPIAWKPLFEKEPGVEG